MIKKIGNISYDLFSSSIYRLRLIHDLKVNLNKLGIDVTNCDALGAAEYGIIKLLNDGMNLECNNRDEISYFCYERDFGRDNSLGDCVCNNKNYPLNTYVDLWNWIAAVEGIENKNEYFKPTTNDLMEIECLVGKKYSQNDIICFKVKVADNRVDKDGEMFTRNSLYQLAQMALGHSGVIECSFNNRDILRHNGLRIYKAEIKECKGETNSLLEPVCELYLYTYLSSDSPITKNDYAKAKKIMGSISCSVKDKIKLNSVSEGERDIVVLNNILDVIGWNIELSY